MGEEDATALYHRLNSHERATEMQCKYLKQFSRESQFTEYLRLGLKILLLPI